MKLDSIIELFMFRESGEEDSHSTKPIVTTGSIVWGLLLRSGIIIFLSIIIINTYELYSHWWWSLIFLWFLAAWPAYRQWQSFSKRMKEFEESTLCGSCKRFDPSGQLCTLFDEHVSSSYVPCEGENWEPK